MFRAVRFLLASSALSAFVRIKSEPAEVIVNEWPHASHGAERNHRPSLPHLAGIEPRRLAIDRTRKGRPFRPLINPSVMVP